VCLVVYLLVPILQLSKRRNHSTMFIVKSALERLIWRSAAAQKETATAPQVGVGAAGTGTYLQRGGALLVTAAISVSLIY